MFNKKTMLSTCAALLMFGCATVTAAAPAAVKAMDPQAWQKTLEKMPVGRELEGSKVHAAGACAGCHGPEGVAANEMWPSVAGQPAAVTIKALIDYREDRRNGDPMALMMTAAAKRLSDQDIADLAVFYEKKPLSGKAKSAAAFADEAAMMRLVRKGDPARTITPCAACHGFEGSSNPNGEVPVLYGQNAAYLQTTLKQYRSGQRSSDMLSEMRFFARKLTEEEIGDLALYYASKPAAGGKTVPKQDSGKLQSDKQ